MFKTCWLPRILNKHWRRMYVPFVEKEHGTFFQWLEDHTPKCVNDVVSLFTNSMRVMWYAHHCMHVWSPSSRSAVGDGIALRRSYDGSKRIRWWLTQMAQRGLGVHKPIGNLTVVFCDVFGRWCVWCVMHDWCSQTLNNRYNMVFLLWCVGQRGIIITGVNETAVKNIWIDLLKNTSAVNTWHVLKRNTVHSFHACIIAQGTVLMTAFLCSQMACVCCYKHLNAIMRGRRRRDQSLAMESHSEDNMVS